MSIALPNNGGRFLTNYDTDNNSFIFALFNSINQFIVRKNIPYLKELYNKIIQSEKAEMVFKKKINENDS